MAFLEEDPIQRLLVATGPRPGSIMPGPEGQPFTVAPPLAPSGLLPSHGPATRVDPELMIPINPSGIPPNIVAPPSTPIGGGLIPSQSTQNVAQTTKNAADLAREDAMREWQEYQSKMQGPQTSTMFGLSTDFFNRHPEVSGGVFVGPNGPQFLFTGNKPKDTLTAANDLIQQMSEKVANALASGDASMAQYFGTQLNSLMAQVSGMTTAQAGASKVPSEIEQNQANARRAQVANVPIGPEGQTGAFSLVPGQAPTQFATGMPASAVPKQTPRDYAMNHLMTAVAPELIKRAYDITLPPEERASAMQQYKGVMQYAENMMSQVQPGTAAKPTIDQFLIAARKTNPGWNDAAITAEYYKKYGR